MINIFPIQKQQEYPVFGHFNDRYGDILINHCPQLAKFQINILTSDEFCSSPGDLPMIELNSLDAFAYSSDLQEDDAAFTKAGIIINPTQIERLELTEEEQYAAIAHEIGHIIFRFSSLKDHYSDTLGQEVFADLVACEIGLHQQLLTIIHKLINSGMYADTFSLLCDRISFIESLCKISSVKYC